MKDQVEVTREARTAWPMVPISEIADHCLGKMLDKHKNKGTPKPYLRNLNVRWFDFDTSDVLDMRFEDHEADRYQAREGDLIVCEGGYPGRAAIWSDEEPIYLQKALHRVRFHEPERAQWVLYWLHFKDLNGSLSEAFSGTGIQHFTKAALSRFEVPLPSLEEQKRIVAVLDQAFAALDRARAHAEANLADAHQLLKSAQVEAARQSENWITATIRDIVRVKSGDFLPKKEMNESGTVPVFGGNGIAGTHDKANLSGRNIVIGRVGAKCGNVHLVDGPIWLTDNAFHVAEIHEEFDLEFLALLLKSADLRSTANQAAQPVISGKTIGPVMVTYPASVNEQRAWIGRLKAIEERTSTLGERYELRLADIAGLRQSLLHEAFAGRLT